jgi:polar amino acid transport system substrate-binding protein
MDIPREPFYMKELEIRMSRSYGPGRYDRSFEEGGKDYPYAYVRFTERRNMSSFLDLVADGSVQLAPMITHRFPIEDATSAYDVMRGDRKQNYLGILLEYSDSKTSVTNRVNIRPATLTSREKIRLGVIGAGKYAATNLLPHLRRQSSVVFGSICTGTGLTAVNIAERFGFESADADADNVIAESDAVLIATRHQEHARYVSKALQQGKAVFVEKPMAVNSQQLHDILHVAGESASVMVGFNRRFAPAVKVLQDYLRPNSEPRQVLIRVNAGAIPLDHWIHDQNVGGGRLIGEGCHFLDLAAYLCGAPIEVVQAVAIPQKGRSHVVWDNFSINLSFANGGIATIVYSSIGDPELPKEYVEVFAGGKVGILRDFKEVELWSHGKKFRTRYSSQDKGQQNQVETWVKSLHGGPIPIPFDQIVNVHQACFAALESINVGVPVTL